MTILEGQILQCQAYVNWYQTRILSGVYKSRIVRRGSADSQGHIILSERELLEDEINTMHRHIEIMGECINHFPTK
jgi:hypothetical protein